MADRKVLVILAEGFEEVEALSPVDVLRRCGAAVTVAGLGSLQVKGAHGVPVICDSLLDDVASVAYDAIVLPGGMPGAANLHASATVNDIVKKTFRRGNYVCAICASPAFVLAPTGILEKKKVTCYPGCETVAPQVSFGKYRTVRDGNIITAAGPGTALEFGLLIAEALFGTEASSKVHSDMICR